MRVCAITLDLDDTLWPVMPALERADEDVHAYLQTHHRPVADAWPITAMRELRARIAAERLDLAHDFTTQRQLTMQHAFAVCGIDEAPIDALWEVYFSARNRVELYVDALPALRRITARWPLVSLTNGNADLGRVGIETYFRHHISARSVGSAKPARAIFDAAVTQLELAPDQVLHVGDDPALDVVGARDAGLHTAWINRERRPWPAALGEPPDLDLPDLGALADWLEAHDGPPPTQPDGTAGR